MNKFSMKSIPAAVALTAALAFSAHAQNTGVRVGANTNISSDVRANATGGGASVGTNANVNTSTNTSVDNSNAPGVRGAAARTGDRVGNAIGRAGNAVGSATERVTRAPRNAIKSGAARADRGINKGLRTDGPSAATGATVDTSTGNPNQQK